MYCHTLAGRRNSRGLLYAHTEPLDRAMEPVYVALLPSSNLHIHARDGIGVGVGDWKANEVTVRPPSDRASAVSARRSVHSSARSRSGSRAAVAWADDEDADGSADADADAVADDEDDDSDMDAARVEFECECTVEYCCS